MPADSLAGQLFELAEPEVPARRRCGRWSAIGIGVAIFTVGLWRLMGVLLEPFPARREPLVELVYQKRSLARGPRIVAIGGGTGLSTLLRGLKEVSSNITAVVTVADDGGSSGKLREELGMPPVGDIRNCIAALADAEPTMTRLLQYRFPATRWRARARRPRLRQPAHRGPGRTSPATSRRASASPTASSPCAARWCRSHRSPLTLHAELADGTQLEGQSRIMRSRGIRRVWLSPARVEASPEAVEAIRAADLIVIGPGLALHQPAAEPARARHPLRPRGARGLRVYVCNVATQPGETEGYTLSEHVAALHAHDVGQLVDVVLANDNHDARVPEDYPAAPVRIDMPAGGARPPPGADRGSWTPRTRTGTIHGAWRTPSCDLLDAARGGSARGTRAQRLARQRAVAQTATSWRPSAPSWRPSSRLDAAAGPPSEPASGMPPAAGPAHPWWPGWRCAWPTRTPTRDLRGRLRLGAARGHCRAAWLRGRFLAAGSLSLGAQRAAPGAGRATCGGDELARRLEEAGFPAALRLRRGRVVVTWKRTDTILAFLRSCGASASVLELESRLVMRQLHGHLNRVLNAETANLTRSVASSARHIAIIELLEAEGRLAELPAADRVVAAERRAAPEASFAELAERLGMSRARVQRAFERLEAAASHVEMAGSTTTPAGDL